MRYVRFKHNERNSWMLFLVYLGVIGHFRTLLFTVLTLSTLAFPIYVLTPCVDEISPNMFYFISGISHSILGCDKIYKHMQTYWHITPKQDEIQT